MTRLFNRLRGARTRTKVLGLSAILVLIAGVAVAAPTGVLTPGSGASGGVTTVGPVNPNNGFPDWYRDTNGVDLMPCDDPQDPNCPAVAVPDSTQPVDFPGNFPEEFFYAQADAQNLTSNGGVGVLAQFSLEGAFLNGGPAPGDQMVFDRIRYKILSGLQPNTDYKITQPYGSDTVTSDANGGFFVTQDVGAVAGDFAAALKGRIGPFLRWAPNPNNAADVPPTGYLGDGVTPHKVIGSELKDASGNLQNYVRIDGPGIGGANNPNPCPGLTATTSPNCIYSDTFNIIGKQALNQGADVAKATYEKDALGQNAFINVLSNSGNQQHIEVQDGDNGPGVNRLFPTTPLRNLAGRYFARVAVPGALPASVDVVNKGDVPQTVTHVKLTDDVQASAVYHVTTAGPDSLHVTGASSDKTLDGTALTVGPYNQKLAANGQLDIPTDAPPANVTVTSSQGGSVSVPVVIDGQGLAPTKLAAAAGPDDLVSQGATETLDGSGSSGNINTYQWTQDPADATQVTLTNANAVKATFKAPLTQTDLHFTLTITGPNGTSDSDQVTITTKANLGAHAAITPVDSLVLQNLPITLDGSTSDGVKYEWSQVSGPAVNLGAANAKTETFLFPKMANPTAIVIQLRVRSASDTTPAGSNVCPATVCDTAQITLNPAIDNLNGSPIVAKYDSSKQRWVVSGTSPILASNNVRVHNGSAVGADGFPNGATIGSALVDPTGAWKVDVRGSTITPGTGANRVISVESDRGGKVLSIPVP